MEELGRDGTASRDEQVARVVWAAQILSFLTKKNNIADPQPEAFEEEVNDNDPQSDVDSDMNAMLTGPRRPICIKVLDCIAQLLSPSKGWEYVTATSLREEEDSIEIHVARNDCFNEDENGSFQFKRLCEMLEEHLSTATHAISGTLLTDLERLAINYAHARVDYWASQLRNILDSSSGRPSWEKGKWHGEQFTVPAWEGLLELLARGASESSETRYETVYQAYRCTASPEFNDFLQEVFNANVASRVWRTVSFLARPVRDCRLLYSIALSEPQFRSIQISPLRQSQPTTIKPEYRVDVLDAWDRLMLPLPTASTKREIVQFQHQFKKKCAKSYAPHAEVQLFAHYELQPEAKPSLDYFGGSKKSCFLCQGFLKSLSNPINTRGSHGVCYPAWGVPYPRSSDAIDALVRLEQQLVSQIQTFLPGLGGRAKVRHAPAVAQSSVASDLPESTFDDIRRQQATLKLAKDQETERREQRLILEGHAMAPRSENPPSDFEPHNSCVMCNKALAKQCKQCNSCYYCSKGCQKADWPSHKLLCKALSTQAPRPSPNHRRAIYFPAENPKPEIMWLPCELKRSSDDEIYGDTTPFERVNTYPYLGQDRPMVGRMRIEHNPIRFRNLGCGMSAPATRKEGYCIEVIHREAYLYDGSAVNESIMASVSTTGQVHYPFCGPMIAMRETPFETYGDITLADFRHIIDYLVSYRTTEVRECNDEPGIRSYSMIRGAKMCCDGEIRLHGSRPFVSVDVPRAHSIRPHSIRQSGDGDISPISQRLGMPIRVWKCCDTENWMDTPGWSDNRNVTFLMMSLDSEGWGWAPPHWQAQIGNAIAVRTDDKDLALDDFAAMCYFVREKLRPMIEDALGGGLVARTRESVMEFMVWENVERCKAEMAEMADEVESNTNE